MTVRILTGDCVDIMRTLPNESIDAIVTDPPYGLAFMGKAWDTAKDPRAFQQRAYEWSLEMGRVLKPGGHLLAFGGTRTYHRLACGLEDAGFEIRDSLHWLYGSGFPKSLNLDGGLGTALKPAHEPIVLARKRLIGTVAATVAKYGTGALNVEACRVGTDVVHSNGGGFSDSFRVMEGRPDRQAPKPSDSVGRWPPNLLLSHTPECIEGGACAEDCPVAEMDRQSGELTSGKMLATQERKATLGGGGYGGGFGSIAAHNDTPGDSGGASRFFPVFRYEAKPSRAEREAGLTGATRVGGGHVAQQDGKRMGRTADEGANVRQLPLVRNIHPTVKPIALMAWLVQLVTPKGGTVLDPFLGSGTTAIACQRLGLDCIGIEKEAEYVAIAEARIRGDAPLFAKVD